MKSTSIFVVAMLLLLTAGSAFAACTWCGSGSWAQCASNPASGCWGWENNASCLKSGCTSSGCTAVCSGSSSSSSSSGSCPSSVSCPTSSSCGCYLVSGLSSGKSNLRNAGGSQYMVASAMMETDTMTTNYSYCDGKSGDSCCCGVTKANYWEARTSGCSNTGNVSSWCSGMNSSRGTDVSCWNSIRGHYGSNYWAVHRNGQSGLSNPNTGDIRGFKAVNDWTNNNIGSHLSDNVRFWSNVVAI